MTINLDQYQVWFITGSQHLYGDEILKQVSSHAKQFSQALSAGQEIPVTVVYKDIITSAGAATQLIMEANQSPDCIGVIGWMHTFSPAKMWISALKRLQKPLLHLHTQFHAEIPWDSIDMEYMNLHQSAHGGREFGFINTRLALNRKVVVGHWSRSEVIQKIGVWTRVCCACFDSQSLKVARFGDNMRDVAVTEGNKVSAQVQFGYEVNGYGLGDLARSINDQKESAVMQLVAEYQDRYELVASLQKGGEHYHSLKEAAKIELGIEAFLLNGHFGAFTTNFENLHGLHQLPGIAVQRLMEKGYGFGAEGDWKTAALLRHFKIMSFGMPGGSSFMEDYTYQFGNRESLVLGAHMLEICPSITDENPSCEIHPLSIGSKSDPVRLVFTGSPGSAINASIVDLGSRFRIIINEVEAMKPPEELPKLPVARILWKPEPNLGTAAASWILAGGAHHTVYSNQISKEFMEDLAEIFGIELVVIDKNTSLYQFKQNLLWNQAHYQSKNLI